MNNDKINSKNYFTNYNDLKIWKCCITYMFLKNVLKNLKKISKNKIGWLIKYKFFK